MNKRLPIGEMQWKIELVTPVGKVADGAGGFTEGSLSNKRTYWVKAEQYASRRLAGFKGIDADQLVLAGVWIFTGNRRKEFDPTSSDVVIFEGKEMSIISVTSTLVTTQIMAHTRSV